MVPNRPTPPRRRLTGLLGAPLLAALAATLGLTLLAPTPLPAQSSTPPRLAALGPGDGVKLRIYREPELSGEYVIDDQGIAILPKIGEFSFRGLPADSVRPVLRRAYQKFLSSESIEITPFRRVAVTGAVLKPGLYPVDPSLSVADLLILAGGVSPDGVLNVVELRVAGATSGARIGQELPVWDTQAGGTNQLYVPRKPWVRRNGVASLSILFSAMTAIAWTVQLLR